MKWKKGICVCALCRAHHIFKCLWCRHRYRDEHPHLCMHPQTLTAKAATPQPICFKLSGEKKTATKLKEKDVCLGCGWVAVLRGTLICKQPMSPSVFPSLACRHSPNYGQTSSLNGHCTVRGNICSNKLGSILPEAHRIPNLVRLRRFYSSFPLVRESVDD